MPRTSTLPPLLALCGFLPLLSCGGKKPPTYLTQASSVGDVRDVVSATGQIEARTKVNVGSQVSGTLSRVNVTWNDAVQAGQVLAELDPRLYAAQLARATALVRVAQANVQKAQVDGRDRSRVLRRSAALAAAKLISQAELEAAELARDQAGAALAGAEAALTQAQADADQARANLAFTRIVSPIDGVVLDRQVDAGQTVAAQFQVATLFTIAADMHHVQVVVSVDEADIGKLRVPLAAEFRVAAYPRRTFHGNVVAVRPAPAAAISGSSTSVVTYAAVVEADNADNLLRQGMTAELEVVTSQNSNVVRVPSAALRWQPAGEGAANDAPVADAAATPGSSGSADAAAASGSSGSADAAAAPASPDAAGPAPGANPAPAPLATHAGHLYVLTAGKPVRRAVTLGLSDGQFVAVLAGLAANEQVIVGATGPGEESARDRRY